MNFWVWALFILLFCLFDHHRQGTPIYSNVTVLRVIDGDSLLVSIGKKELQIRLAYVDAPELKQMDLKHRPWGKWAQMRLQQWLSQGAVQVKILGRDIYGRYLAEVYVDGQLVNYLLVKEGLAPIYAGSKFSSVRLRLQFWSAQRVAGLKKLGIWSNSKFLNPRFYRKARRTKMH